jgi:DNA (cytosine-5)-methyltransferase 1
MSGKAFSAMPDGPNTLLGHEATSFYRVLSLFSGAGGMDLGFTGGFTYLGQHYERLPFQIVRAYDVDPRAVATYNANLDPVCQVADVTTLELGELPRGIDVVLGGFPCQDFSFTGKRQGLTVHRGRLYLAMVRVIEALTPKVFVAENVKGLLSANGGLAKEIITNDFANAGPGYRIYTRVLDAADYGVPQRRERVFIVGVRKDLKGEFRFPEPTHHKLGGGPLIALPKWRSVKEALEDLEDPEAHAKLPNAEWVMSGPSLRWKRDHPLDPNTPSKTILAEHVLFHYKLGRRLSVRESARLQGFPDTFTFLAPSVSSGYRLVGNAIPPVLAWHIARSVAKFLTESGASKVRGGSYEAATV